MLHCYKTFVFGLVLGSGGLLAHSEPVITHLKTRHHHITVKAGEGMTLYSISDEKGASLLEDVSCEELKATSPKLYEEVKSAIADSSTSLLAM